MHLGRLGDGPALPPCNTITVPAGFVGPVNCDPSAGGVNYAASQAQFANLSSQLQDLQSQVTDLPTSVSPTMLAIVAGGLFLVMMMMSKK